MVGHEDTGEQRLSRADDCGAQVIGEAGAVVIIVELLGPHDVAGGVVEGLGPVDAGLARGVGGVGRGGAEPERGNSAS